MTEPDIIRIDGVEYDFVYHLDALGPYVYKLRPKRKQTGWICRGCSRAAPCVEITTSADDPPTGCLRNAMGDLIADRSAWERFYGKVEE